jgi:hypothetical protein
LFENLKFKYRNKGYEGDDGDDDNDDDHAFSWMTLKQSSNDKGTASFFINSHLTMGFAVGSPILSGLSEYMSK